MQQHPVPQHIASYEFRLVGDMTLKQFGMLAICCLLALLFYVSGLPGYFKWPLVIFFVLLGVGLAFIPFEERPLHQWLISFFKSVYTPTQFIWKKTPLKIEIFESSQTKHQKAFKTAPKFKTGQKTLQEYLQSLPVEKSPLEKKEAAFLKKIDNLFGMAPKTFSPTPPLATVPAAPVQTPSPKIRPYPNEIKIPEPKPEVTKPRFKPQPVKIKIEPEKKKPVVEAKMSSHLPFPQTPTAPNLLVGMVLDPKGKIIEGAILEIRDNQGIPVRALKTNKLGQFRIVNPLKNGSYEIETEKEGYFFDIIKVELKGQPVAPIEIRAQNTAQNV